ncbi:MAG: ABC transporter permease [Burkholderiaceae bacterium]|nr:ABC transporter permease [Burkholderiaceae bacterium]
MGRQLLSRLWHGLIVIFGVTVIVFVVTRMVGDPVAMMLPLEATAEQRSAFEHELGFDRPIAVQFGEFVAGAARLDFGDSLWQRRPAMEIVLEKLPATLLLTFLGIGLAIVLAIPIGIVAALRPGGGADQFTVSFSLAGLSIPQFWLGLILIYLFAVRLHWLPTSGTGTPAHVVLPMITMALPALARLVMTVRSAMIDELNQQYARTARAKGLSRFRVVGVHALRNALVPILTLAGWEVIRALAGYSVVVETVFAWPGLGLATMQAIERHDLILLQSVVFTVAALVVVTNIALDAIYQRVDPRMKLT